ncbi:MAG: hypothetical protein HY434_02550 [Candidatus Liptonbacteria bacterium]|nr:hypothetical protein [Candidatus Liptonbacteria bacterium]
MMRQPRKGKFRDVDGVDYYYDVFGIHRIRRVGEYEYWWHKSVDVGAIESGNYRVDGNIGVSCSGFGPFALFVAKKEDGSKRFFVARTLAPPCAHEEIGEDKARKLSHRPVRDGLSDWGGYF